MSCWFGDIYYMPSDQTEYMIVSYLGSILL